MICSKCGTNNSKTSKFCRECGNRLIVESLGLEQGVVVEPVEPADDGAVSDVLYEALKMLEQDQLEGAFRKCRQALGINPASTSARSLLALIYERKADAEFRAGNRIDAEDYVNAAIIQMERVLEANPGSVADREKLDGLHARLSMDLTPVKTPAKGFVDRFLAEVRKVPVPVAASAGTVVIVFLLVLIIFSAAKPKQADRKVVLTPPAAQSEQREGTPVGASPQGYAQALAQGAAPAYPPGYAAQPQQQAQQPYPYPQPAPSQQTGYAAGGGQLPAPPVVEQTVEPVRPLAPLPGSKPIEPAKSTIAARPRKIDSAPSQPAPVVRAASVDDARQAYGRGDYAAAASMFESAIAGGADSAENNQLLGTCLYNLGRRTDAVGKFERAINLYLDRRSKGEGVASADQGIRACKQFIELSRE